VAIGFGKSKEEDVVALIAAKKYARAIEVLKAQLQKKGANPSLRMQLADVLILADKKQEAIGLLIPLADQYAREGFAAKAVSVLKKIQKIDPGRRDVEERLARQIEEKQREAVVALPISRPGGRETEAGFEDGPSLEIGFEAAPISAPPAVAASAPISVPPAAPAPPALAVPPALAAVPPDATLPAAAAVRVVPVEPDLGPSLDLPDPEPEIPSEPALVFPPSAAPALAAASAPAASGSAAGEVEDYDLLYIAEGDEEEADDIDVPIEVELVESAAAEPMSAGQFADELMGLVDSVFQEFPGQPGAAALASAASPVAASSARGGGSQIVVSPLFRDFSVDEMVAVIHGLKLLSFERGEVILREGQPGGSLYMLTAGRVRAFKKDPAGRQSPLGDLKEGAFFGEMSILTGQPRMASVVALSRCELLELDRPTLDGITKTHPHVWDVLKEFAEKRTAPAR
jgi:hypothetical protein